MSDTPETDKFRASLDGMREINQRDRLLSHARKLERERDELRSKYAIHHAEADRLTDERDRMQALAEDNGKLAHASACEAMEYRAERDELIFHLAKCHEAIGESPDSDNSELWRYFENFKSTINRLRIIEQTAENIRTARGFLPGGGRV